MKIFKKILIILAIIIIAVGMYLLGRNGLNFVDGYSQNILLETAKQYTIYVAISTVIILFYLVIRYNKQGILRVIITSVLGIAGTLILVLAIMAISQMPTNRIFFPIMLGSYVCSIIALSTYFEENA